MSPVARLLTACLLLLPGWSSAQVPVESDPRIEEQTRGVTSYRDEEWVEGEFELPAYPADDDLLPVPGQSASSRLEVFIDPQSISIGDDGVTRYTMVLTSRHGARNVIHEGIRCSEVSHRVYAYGDGQGGFGKLLDARWVRLKPESGTYGYRYVLARSIICDQLNRARPPEDVVSVLRYPKGSMDEKEY
jgi:hypothetical protein